MKSIFVADFGREDIFRGSFGRSDKKGKRRKEKTYYDGDFVGCGLETEIVEITKSGGV